MFAVVFPGWPLSTEFQPVGDGKLSIAVPSPHTITQFTLCLMSAEIPPGSGVGVYCGVSAPNSPLEWHFAGSLSLSCPSRIFPAMWTRDPNYNRNAPMNVHIALSLEPLDVLENLSPQAENNRLNSVAGTAVRVAKHVYNFLQSFTGTPNDQDVHMGEAHYPPGMLVIPSDILDRWFQKFNRKLQTDPEFLFRNNA